MLSLFSKHTQHSKYFMLSGYPNQLGYILSMFFINKTVNEWSVSWMSPCSKNLDTQKDYYSRHGLISKLGLRGPRTNINSFGPIMNHSEHF